MEKDALTPLSRQQTPARIASLVSRSRRALQAGKAALRPYRINYQRLKTSGGSLPLEARPKPRLRSKTLNAKGLLKCHKVKECLILCHANSLDSIEH